jgi:hypothetical protein
MNVVFTSLLSAKKENLCVVVKDKTMGHKESLCHGSLWDCSTSSLTLEDGYVHQMSLWLAVAVGQANLRS